MTTIRKAAGAALAEDNALLDAALNEIEFASHSDFSTALVKHNKQLRIMADRAMFLQKAAEDFKLRFVASVEASIQAGKSWGEKELSQKALDRAKKILRLCDLR
ncbi:hypothetical protein RX327_32605 [Bradyrhizobium sp. BEA-2-5]|uniref:hypothetical protein n=1 Tax=Bradyrhizobium sp. BEA-2-5 TaxID=3080015 RepID=UPI00293E2457|nr:hypothetical protein [Bradyrhizobium sp. BEA-2-5]WOH80474.1 hypothetical protein RX327_32605 [Bradyrhizobium sp. BEA-2-5]